MIGRVSRLFMQGQIRLNGSRTHQSIGRSIDRPQQKNNAGELHTRAHMDRRAGGVHLAPCRPKKGSTHASTTYTELMNPRIHASTQSCTHLVLGDGLLHQVLEVVVEVLLAPEEEHQLFVVVRLFVGGIDGVSIDQGDMNWGG